MSWIVELLDEDVLAQLKALPEDMQAHFRRLVEIIRSHGLEKLVSRT